MGVKLGNLLGGSGAVLCAAMIFFGSTFVLWLISGAALLCLGAMLYLGALGMYIFLGGIGPLSLLQNGLSEEITHGVATGDLEAARRSILASVLRQSYTIVGNGKTTSLFELQRGSIKRDTRLPLMSASKLATAAAVHSAAYRMRDSRNQRGDRLFHLGSKPSDFLDWWTTDPEDFRSYITVHDLLAMRTGLVNPGFGGAFRKGSDASLGGWEHYARKIYDSSANRSILPRGGRKPVFDFEYSSRQSFITSYR